MVYKLFFSFKMKKNLQKPSIFSILIFNILTNKLVAWHMSVDNFYGKFGDFAFSKILTEKIQKQSEVFVGTLL